MDIRKGIFSSKTSENCKYKSSRRYKINPDVVSEWKNAPWPDNYFDLIVFDPPHIVVNNRDKKFSGMEIEYGRLYKDNFKIVLNNGIKKLFNILKPEGIFVFKWCEDSIKIEEILKLFPYKPLFGSNTKSKGHTANFWILFIKHRFEKKLIEYDEI